MLGQHDTHGHVLIQHMWIDSTVGPEHSPLDCHQFGLILACLKVTLP